MFSKFLTVVFLGLVFIFSGCSSSMANLSPKQMEAIQAIADNKFINPYDGAPSWAQNPIQFAEKNGLGLVSVGMVSIDYISSSEALSRAKDRARIELAEMIGVKAQRMVEDYSSSQRAGRNNDSFSNRTNVYRMTTDQAMIGTQVLYTAFNNGHAFVLVGMNISKIKSMMSELGTLVPEIERNNFSQAINDLSSRAFEKMDKQLSSERRGNNYQRPRDSNFQDNNYQNSRRNYQRSNNQGFNNYTPKGYQQPVNVGLKQARNSR